MLNIGEQPIMLTAKQQRFIDEYLASFNGTGAAIKAGYSEKTARAIASENLKKPTIKAEIERRRAKVHAEASSQRIRILEELGKLAFANLGPIFKDGELLDPSEWPKEQREIVQFKLRERFANDKDGKSRRVARNLEVGLPHKLEALELLAELTGLIEPGSRRRSRRGRPTRLRSKASTGKLRSTNPRKSK